MSQQSLGIVTRYPEHYDDRFLRSIKIRPEEYFEGLDAIRLTAELGGLLRITKGRLFLTNKCNKAFNSGGMKTTRPLLFNAYSNNILATYYSDHGRGNFYQEQVLTP